MSYSDDDLSTEEKSFKMTDEFSDDLDEMNEPLDDTLDEFGLLKEDEEIE